jgi:hypothetical protein
MSGFNLDLYNAIREDAFPTEIILQNRQYTIRNVIPVLEPEPAPFEVSTLTGLVDYIKANVDDLDIKKLICHVVSPTTVSLESSLFGDFAQRAKYIVANARVRTMQFNTFLDSEAFNIWLQSCFVEREISGNNGTCKGTDKRLILQYVGNVKESAVKEVGDDGISQEVTVKSGIATLKNVTLPNPVILCPYRTFNEVQQPESSFVFRAQDGPKFALIDADNGAWESVAMKNIKEFLESEIKELNVIA